MEAGLFIGLIAGALAGAFAASELRFVRLHRSGAALLGALGGWIGLGVAAQIAANTTAGEVLLPGLTDVAVGAIVSGAIGGGAMVALYGVVSALLAER